MNYLCSPLQSIIGSHKAKPITMLSKLKLSYGFYAALKSINYTSDKLFVARAKVRDPTHLISVSRKHVEDSATRRRVKKGGRRGKYRGEGRVVEARRGEDRHLRGEGKLYLHQKCSATRGRRASSCNISLINNTKSRECRGRIIERCD